MMFGSMNGAQTTHRARQTDLGRGMETLSLDLLSASPIEGLEGESYLEEGNCHLESFVAEILRV